MCFSINKGVKVPPSLVNIYKALENDPKIDFKMPAKNVIHGDLTSWAKQGVFLLNVVLTVRAGKSNSHAKKGWETFTTQTIKAINKYCENVVYLLWGKFAHKTAEMVNKEKNLVICEVHPSPLAGVGFKTTKCFSECNDYLISKGKKPIEWDVFKK